MCPLPFSYMSIAVSAIVHPSRLLLALVGFTSAVGSIVGVLVAVGLVGSLAVGPRMVLGTAVFFLALFGFYHGVRDRKTIQLDIYGTGAIRIAETSTEESCTHGIRPHVTSSGRTVRLLTSSTIWPNLLLLRCRGDEGRTIVLPIFPDSVSREAFRAISVACRWIAAQDLDEEMERPSK